MSGILDNKTRVMDVIMTGEGRARLARGELSLKYCTFTDAASFYEPDVVSGSMDATKRLYLESFSTPADVITFNFDANAQVDQGISQAIAVFDGRVKSIYSSSFLVTQLNEDLPTSSVDLISFSSLEAIKNQQIIGTFDDIFEPDAVLISSDDVKFSITDNGPLNEIDQVVNINYLSRIFDDPHFSHLPNVKFLPPINNSKLTTSSLTLSEQLPKPRITESQDFFQVIKNDSVYSDLSPYTKKIFFEQTTISNNTAVQFFEISGSLDGNNQSINKLMLIDAGYQQLNGEYPTRVCYAGKLLRNDYGVDVFVRLFALLFE